MTGVVLGGFAAVVGCAEALVLAGLDIALLRGLRRRRREQAVAALAPRIRTLMVDFLAGADKVNELRSVLNQDAGALTEGILSFRNAVAGGARDRLCELALDLGLVRDWCADARSSSVAVRREVFDRLAFVCAYEPCRRLAGEIQSAALEDPDDEVRISAARGLIQSGDTRAIESVFAFALSSDLLTRAVIAEDLRRYAAELSEHAIPAALSSRKSQKVLAALEIISAWQRALMIPDLAGLLRHTETAIRVHALRLAPLMPPTAESRSAIVESLADDDPEVRATAAISAGRMRIEESIPYLASLVESGGVELARNAASAMAGMPPLGWKALQELTEGGGLAAEIARAALPLRGGAKA